MESYDAAILVVACTGTLTSIIKKQAYSKRLIRVYYAVVYREEAQQVARLEIQRKFRHAQE